MNNKNGRDLLVKVEFTRGNDTIQVVRGIKPNVFEIYINDKLVDQSSKTRDYQKYFEEVILGIDYVAFTQIVMIGKANYIPFMALNAGARRSFVERVLGLDVFRAMLEVHKSNVDNVNSQIQDHKNEIKVIGERIKSQERLVTHIQVTSQKTIDEKKAMLSSEIDNIKAEIARLELEKTEKKDLLDSLDIKTAKDETTKTSQTITNIRDLLSQIESNRTITTRELKFFDANDVCPTCTQPIEQTFKTEAVDKRTARMQQFDKSIAELEIRLDDTEQANKTATLKIEQAKKLLSDIQPLKKLVAKRIIILRN